MAAAASSAAVLAAPGPASLLGLVFFSSDLFCQVWRHFYVDVID